MRTLDELGISPAPWTISDDLMSFPECAVNIKCNLWDVAKYCRHADARLIAAAPELYEALNGLVDFIDRECVPCGENACELMTIAHAALAKASGESEEGEQL